MEGRARKCERCNMFVALDSYEKHLQDKRHRLREKRFIEMMQNSVFMSHLPKNVTENILLDALKVFGNVRFFSLYTRTNTAIAEFELRETAERVLQANVFVMDTLIRTAPRKEPKVKEVVIRQADVEPNVLISTLEKGRSDGATDVDKLIKLTVETVQLKDPNHVRKLFQLQKDLEESISKLLPGCRAMPFGSTVTGLSLQGSDADIVILTYGEANSDFDSAKLVKRVRKVLWGWRRKFGSIVAIPEAKIPIIKVVHESSGIACDISFQGQACVIKSEQLSYLLDIDSRTRPLIIFLKYWGKCHNLINSSRFSSYAATLMVVFFLQQLPEPILPPIHSVVHSDWGAKKMTVTNKDPLSKLVEGFFRYYSEIDMANQVICPRVGHLVLREVFSGTARNTLSEKVEDIRRLTCEYSNPLDINTSLVVQDPYELNRNVTERVKHKDFTYLQMCCTEAVKVMEKGDPTYLFKNFSVPSELDMFTTLRADQYLKPEYLGPTDANVAGVRKILLKRWLEAILALMPEFLTRFVRVKVEPNVDDSKGQTLPDVSLLTDDVISQYLPQSWKCSGKPVFQTWSIRRKVANKLKLDPKLPMMERESCISEHLEQVSSETEPVSFTFLLTPGPKSDSIRCIFRAYTAATNVFRIVSGNLISLMPLWINSAFESGIGLKYISSVCSPDIKHIQDDLSADVCFSDGIGQSSSTETDRRKDDADKKTDVMISS